MSLNDNLYLFPNIRGRVTFTAEEWKRAEAAIERMRAAARLRCTIHVAKGKPKGVRSK